LPGLIRAGQGVHGDGADVFLFHQLVERGGAIISRGEKPRATAADRKRGMAVPAIKGRRAAPSPPLLPDGRDARATPQTAREVHGSFFS
jgi:hypothetical protein